MIRIIPQADLAEFFCEDPKTFRIEECFKAFHQFCSNFKTAVTENEKRREQERMAEQRRLQRENDQVLESTFFLIITIIIIITIVMAEEEAPEGERPGLERHHHDHHHYHYHDRAEEAAEGE